MDVVDIRGTPPLIKIIDYQSKQKSVYSSDRRGVQCRRLGVYPSVKPVFVVPSSILPNLVQPFRKLPQQVDELLGDVSDGPLDLSLVLRVVGVREQGFYPVAPTPFLPSLLELAAVVREDFPRLPGKSPQQLDEFIGGRLVASSMAEPRWWGDGEMKQEMETG